LASAACPEVVEARGRQFNSSCHLIFVVRLQLCRGIPVQSPIDQLERLPLRCQRWWPERLLIPLRMGYIIIEYGI